MNLCWNKAEKLSFLMNQKFQFCASSMQYFFPTGYQKSKFCMSFVGLKKKIKKTIFSHLFARQLTSINKAQEEMITWQKTFIFHSNKWCCQLDHSQFACAPAAVFLECLRFFRAQVVKIDPRSRTFQLLERTSSINPLVSWVWGTGTHKDFNRKGGLKQAKDSCSAVYLSTLVNHWHQNLKISSKCGMPLIPCLQAFQSVASCRRLMIMKSVSLFKVWIDCCLKHFVF